ncbi:MAG: hypothetical protein LBG98_03420 [Puniceicoccales bacterium]|nr:hypothetical protein [Puniceicoccales bacterium]
MKAPALHFFLTAKAANRILLRLGLASFPRLSLAPFGSARYAGHKGGKGKYFPFPSLVKTALQNSIF